MMPVTNPIIFAISRIENMMYQVTFDPAKGSGVIAANVSIIRDSDLNDVLFIFKSVMKCGLGVGSYIRVIRDQASFGDIRLESHECAIITPCSITIDGVLLKGGVSVRPVLGGIVQIKKGVPMRFTDILTYDSTTIDPIDVLMSQDLTSVTDVASTGSGKILANVRIVPMHARERVEGILLTLKLANFDSILFVSEPNTEVLGVPVERDHIGIVAIGGTNPMAAVQEQGIPIRTHALSELIDIDEMETV
ncbi:MAG: Global nitrogen regulator NrpRII [Candidatus Methanogaster sp.]|nr:MAG: Global nitrogen regulator NrpRII [ANME-2 cluster archaeon]